MTFSILSRTLSLSLTGLLLCGSQASAQTLNTYHIGNSLTWDARVVGALPELATDAGYELTTGYHLRCSQSLDYIVDHPGEVCLTPNSFGGYTQAFANHAWDAVTLQPFSLSTPRQEYEAFKSLVQLARVNPDNHDTRFYVYANWPVMPLAEVTFFDAWHDPSPVDPDADLVRRASEFDWIYDQLKADPDLQGVDIHMLSVGDVIAELDLRMRAGLVPEFLDGKRLYRDPVHLDKIGQFTAANTFLATLFERDPSGTPANSQFNMFRGMTQLEILDEPLIEAIQDAVWYVVSQQLLPGDVTGDGLVGIDDLNTILPNWNKTLPPRDQILGDLNSDGVVGISDLSAVLGSWNLSGPADGSLEGDANADGFVGVDDLNIVLGSWNNTAPPVDLFVGDISRDGLIGIDDLSKVLANWNKTFVTSVTVPGDLDGDGFVGINDLNLVLGHWNQNVPPGDPLADPSGDGFIGIDDLNHVLANWNAGTPPTAAATHTIPEPATASFLGLIVFLMLRSRQP